MKRVFKIFGVLAFLMLALVLALAAYLYFTAIQPGRRVGFQHVVAADPGHAPIAVDVWYPTDAEPSVILAESHMEHVASNGAVSGSRLPLVVISHGTGGSAVGHADTAIALAEAGFVVAAPTHNGDNLRDNSEVGRPAWLVDRSRQLSRVVDFMLRGWRDRSHLDASRVGVFGFSAGATTALIAIGGNPDLNQVATHCAAHREFVCNLMVPQGTSSNPSSGWPHDGRIKAAVIAAPGLGFLFEPAGLSQVQAAVQLWAAGEDQTVPFATNAGAVRRLLPQSPEFHSVTGAVHYSFIMPCGLLRFMQPCRDPAGFDRRAFHASFNRSVVGFFLSHLGATAPVSPPTSRQQ